ncbi:AAEL005505-PA, partial [Aedes aegypti]
RWLSLQLDAFSCPTVKKSHQKTTHDLLETKSMLDEERSTCQSLKQQLLENTEREAELQELHRCEINKVEACLEEHQRSAADRITALEAEALRKELEANDKLLSTTELYESRLAEREAELKLSQAREQDLLQRINALTCTENELREKVHSSELEFSERLQAAAMRERDLSEQLKQLNRQMEEMRRAAEARELELEEKISLTQDECTVLRHSRSSLEPSPPNEDHEPPQRTSLGGSLRCVLDLKQREISDLRKLTQEYERDAKELPGALVKISALESRIEDLQVQLRTKTEEEKDLQQKLKLLQDNLKQETKTKTRLSQHNEELQWKLKQNSEKFSHVFMNATRVSLDPPTTSQVNHSRSSAGSERVFEMDDLSPPTSPVIKGVVEKSDSVSWVLEMDDEPPEISASRMVRRAGSFRSSYANAAGGANQDVKRQRCFNTSLNGIQQSSSVGSILKQQEASPSKMGTPTTPRLRSKSVSIKAATEPPKKIVRSNSGASSSAVSKPIRMAEMPLSWKEPPLYSSSPDTPAHKKRREFARKSLTGKSNSLPKEAAGEALVSGSNSDDEASSSSCLSDDLSGSSSSSSSSTGGPSCSSRSSSASLNGTISNEGNDTPMEVSWSEDGDPSESIV